MLAGQLPVGTTAGTLNWPGCAAQTAGRRHDRPRTERRRVRLESDMRTRPEAKKELKRTQANLPRATRCLRGDSRSSGAAGGRHFGGIALPAGYALGARSPEIRRAAARPRRCPGARCGRMLVSAYARFSSAPAGAFWRVLATEKRTAFARGAPRDLTRQPKRRGSCEIHEPAQLHHDQPHRDHTAADMDPVAGVSRQPRHPRPAGRRAGDPGVGGVHRGVHHRRPGWLSGAPAQADHHAGHVAGPAGG